MEFINSLEQIKTNWKPYKQWEEAQDEKEHQRNELKKRANVSKEELEKASKYGHTLIESINVMDQFATDKAQDVEMTSDFVISIGVQILALTGVAISLLVSKIPKVKSYMKKFPEHSFQRTLFAFAPPLVLPLIGYPFLKIKGATYEKEAARTARYQAREEKLKDPKNFVIYNDEQIKKAAEIAKTLPDPPEKNRSSLNFIANYTDAIKSIKTIMNDHNNYLAWKKEYLNKEKSKKDNIKTIETTPEKLQEAKNEQDKILRTIRKIEVNSQNYQSNAETALSAVLGFDLVFGAIIGKFISGAAKLTQKCKLFPKNSPFISKIEHYSTKATPVLLVIATASYATKIQKEAAKMGRFKAKQELLKDPYNFVDYTDEQLSSVKNLKPDKKQEKGFISVIKENINLFFQLKKDYKEYENYQKTKHKEEQKLREALNKIDVSAEQIEKAKTLQKNTFMTFEKIDEISQRYVADLEAATDSGKYLLVSGSNVLSQIAFIYLLSKIPMNKTKKADEIYKAMTPVFIPFAVNVPAEITANQIEKKANKIGIMKAMQELDDPRYFISENNKN